MNDVTICFYHRYWKLQTIYYRKNDVIYERSPSATLGMGHMEQQKQLSYDTASLGAGAGQSSGHAPAPPTSQSCTHLAEVGRSRSDLGYTRPLAPPGPPPPPMMSPKKPPRMYQYGASQASSRRKSMAETHTVNIPISKTQSHGVL